VMYNATIDSKLTVEHPGMGGEITLVIDKVHRGTHLMLRTVKKILRRLSSIASYPVDFIDYDVEIKVLNNDDSECFLKKGKKYMVNMRDKAFLCPATAHALYPYMILERMGYRFRWDGGNESNLVPCPDCIGAVYSVGTRRQGAA